MPGLRRLLDPRERAEGDARARRAARELRVRVGHRLLEPLPLLHEHLRLPHDPRPRAGVRDRHQGAPAGALGVGRDGRRRRPLDRRQPPAAHDPPQRRPPDPALQQPHLRPHQGPVLADLARGHARRSRRPTARSTTRSTRSRSRSAPAPRSSRARSTSTRPHLQEMLRRAHAHKGTAFVEILQNCPVYNDDEWVEVEDRKTRVEAALDARGRRSRSCGAPKGARRGIRIEDGVPSIVRAGATARTRSARASPMHHERHESPAYAFALASLAAPELPAADRRVPRRREGHLRRAARAAGRRARDRQARQGRPRTRCSTPATPGRWRRRRRRYAPKRPPPRLGVPAVPHARARARSRRRRGCRCARACRR